MTSKEFYLAVMNNNLSADTLKYATQKLKAIIDKEQVRSGEKAMTEKQLERVRNSAIKTLFKLNSTDLPLNKSIVKLNDGNCVSGMAYGCFLGNDFENQELPRMSEEECNKNYHFANGVRTLFSNIVDKFAGQYTYEVTRENKEFLDLICKNIKSYKHKDKMSILEKYSKELVNQVELRINDVKIIFNPLLVKTAIELVSGVDGKAVIKVAKANDKATAMVEGANGKSVICPHFVKDYNLTEQEEEQKQQLIWNMKG